jgi:hypothetical protein
MSYTKNTVDSMQNISTFIEWRREHLFFYISPVLVIWQYSTSETKALATTVQPKYTHHK